MDRKIFIIILLSISIYCCSEDKGLLLQGDGERIRDKAGRAVILRGLNLSEANKRPDTETGKFIPPWLDYDDFKRIAGWGFNSIRFIISWEGLEPEPYAYNYEYISEIKGALQMAHNAGLSVILDMHQDIYARRFGGNGAPE